MSNKLFVFLLGGKPPESSIEQHNVYFGVASSIETLYPAIKQFWSSAPKIHIDAYMCVEQVGNHLITPERKEKAVRNDSAPKLFFLNLGGYRQGLFEEVHKKLLIVAVDEISAVAKAREDVFFQEGVQEGKAVPHIDDKRTLDEFEDEVPIDVSGVLEKQGYILVLTEAENLKYPEPIITGFMRIP